MNTCIEDTKEIIAQIKLNAKHKLYEEMMDIDHYSDKTIIDDTTTWPLKKENYLLRILCDELRNKNKLLYNLIDGNKKDDSQISYPNKYTWSNIIKNKTTMNEHAESMKIKAKKEEDKRNIWIS